MVPPPLDEQIIVSATWPHRQQAGTYTVYRGDRAIFLYVCTYSTVHNVSCYFYTILILLGSYFNEYNFPDLHMFKS